MSSPSLGFDDQDNFYILDEYQDAANAATATSGAYRAAEVRLFRVHAEQVPFTNNVQDANEYPGEPLDLKIIYQWDCANNNDRAIDPTMTVDDNLAALPPSVTNQPVDPTSGNVYVSWTSIDIRQASDPAGDPTFNANRIKTVVSSDGGNNFSPITIADANTNKVADTNYQPGRSGNVTGSPALDYNGPDLNSAITVSQGRDPSQSGITGDPGIPPGRSRSPGTTPMAIS